MKRWRLGMELVTRLVACALLRPNAGQATFSDSPAELRLMHVIEKCVRGIRCLVVGQDASEETFSDSPAELRLCQ